MRISRAPDPASCAVQVGHVCGLVCCHADQDVCPDHAPALTQLVISASRSEVPWPEPPPANRGIQRLSNRGERFSFALASRAFASLRPQVRASNAHAPRRRRPTSPSSRLSRSVLSLLLVLGYRRACPELDCDRQASPRTLRAMPRLRRTGLSLLAGCLLTLSFAGCDPFASCSGENCPQGSSPTPDDPNKRPYEQPPPKFEPMKP